MLSVIVLLGLAFALGIRGAYRRQAADAGDDA